MTYRTNGPLRRTRPAVAISESTASSIKKFGCMVEYCMHSSKDCERTSLKEKKVESLINHIIRRITTAE